MAKLEQARTRACTLAAVQGLCALALPALAAEAEGVDVAKGDLRQAIAALEALRFSEVPRDTVVLDPWMSVSLDRLRAISQGL